MDPVAGNHEIAAKIGQLVFLRRFRCKKPRRSQVYTDCGVAVLNQPQVVKARIDAHVPHFGTGPLAGR
jgi:hypothetical protein